MFRRECKVLQLKKFLFTVQLICFWPFWWPRSNHNIILEPFLYSSIPSAETGSAAVKSAGGIFISSPFILISVSGRPVFLCLPLSSDISGASDSFSSSSISASLKIIYMFRSDYGCRKWLWNKLQWWLTSRYHEEDCNRRHLLRHHFPATVQLSTFSSLILLPDSLLLESQLPPKKNHYRSISTYKS